MWRRGDSWKYGGFETLEFRCTKRLHVYDYNRNIDKKKTLNTPTGRHSERMDKGLQVCPNTVYY